MVATVQCRQINLAGTFIKLCLYKHQEIRENETANYGNSNFNNGFWTIRLLRTRHKRGDAASAARPQYRGYFT